MAKISFNDAFDSKFLAELEKLVKLFKELGVEARELNQAVKSAKTFEEMQKNAKKAADSTKKLTTEEKKLEGAVKRLAFAQSDAGKEFAKTTEITRRQVAENKKLAQSQLGLIKRTGRLTKSIAKGNIVANIFSRITRSIGRAIRGTLKSIADFDQAIADVGAISRATDQQLEKLRKTALQLGGSTKFTATEVAGLQKELAKLGFTTTEILNAQSAILSLAAAAQTDLANAATVAGITVNQFGLTANETQRVVDVMARSFTSSALDIDKFTESMKFVGPAAKASGLSIEEATARLAQLADAGISGSLAGTSLRQIMLALSKESGTFSEKIERAAEAGLDLAGAADEVQRRAATALLVLADGVDNVDDLTEALENAAGAADELARKQLDTLHGQITILTSAWNRFVLSVSASESGFRGIKGILSSFSGILNNYVDASNALADIGVEEAQGFLGLFLEGIEGQDISGKVSSLVEELKFIKQETNNYSQELQEANFQLANTKRSEKGVREEWEKRRGVAEGMIRIYKEYFLLLQDVQFEDVVEEISKDIEKLPGVLKESMLKFSKEEQEIWDELIKDINEQFGIFAPMTADELEILNDLIQDNADTMSKDLIDKKKELDAETLKLTKERIDEEIRLERLAEETKRNIKIEIGNEVFRFASAIFDRQLQKAEQNAASQLANDNLTAEQRKKIEKDLAEERTKIQRRAAVVNKAQSLFNIAIDTAAGIVKYGSNPITAPLIPFIIGLGLAQAAVVAATPIPQFAKGTDSAPGGGAIVGEKGSELMVGPDGSIGLTPDTATLIDIQKGTKIFPSDITQELLGYTNILNGLGGRKDERMIMAVMNEMIKSNDKVYNAIKNKPVQSATLTPAGIRTMIYKGNTTIKKMDKYFK